METIDRISVQAPIKRVFEVAVDVERWPEFLSHYRWVRVLERSEHDRLVEMAAWRPFGPVRFPTWWLSRMRVSHDAHIIHYTHVRGLTNGMDVEWQLVARPHGVEIVITHYWKGLPVPVIGSLVASCVIGPVFIHGIASRTLAGVKRRAEWT
ncbi:MAG: type II toxin-antitoxin system RatA family toxin [Gemmatimonadales bacterium]